MSKYSKIIYTICIFWNAPTKYTNRNKKVQLEQQQQNQFKTVNNKSF